VEALDAAFPLVTVNIAGERGFAWQKAESKEKRAQHNDEQGRGAQDKALDKINAGHV